ncbi:MAG: hypothetical protein CMD99_06660 [Gammaproteobacteria bacterium]|nr:hypothetical protein [Gammaproteobacteria bacterium]
MLTLNYGPGLFGFWRQSLDREQNIFAIFNVTKEPRILHVDNLDLTLDHTWLDLVVGDSVTDRSGPLELEPYRFLWIGNNS